MNLSFFYFSFILFIFLSIIDSTQVDIQCPTSRRLLLFGIGEKASSRSSSSSKSLSSSPPKYARSSDSHGLTVYIQPQTSAELGRKVRSYTHLLKSKLSTTDEKTRSKRSQSTKKKSSKKKTSLPVAKTQDLATTNTDELQRCQALLQIDSTATIDDKKKKKINKTITTTKTKNSPTPTNNSPKTEKKIKSNEQRSKPSKTNENRPVSSSANDLPRKASSSESTSQPKSKRTKADTITIIQQTTIPFETDENEIDEKNHSVVNRAFHFMKNIFQLSENLLEDNSPEDDSVIHMSNDHHHSRKLLSIDEDEDETWTNLGISECKVDRSSFAVTSLSKRQLLSVKTNKQSTSSKSTNTKEKKQKSLAKTDDSKPKVGWAYRYRISRYLAAQKMKRSGSKSKPSENEDKNKKFESMTSKVSKRKLLVYSDNDDDQSSCQKDQISDESVLITETFHPKRQLLSSKTKDHTFKTKETTHVDKLKTRRRKKAIENLTDPIVIIQSYERGTYKPQVGWQFRYRVSRYIDSLRETIREDQQRLRVGLQDIQGKKSQEFSGRRKRPTDKSLSSEIDPLDKRQARVKQKKKTTTTSLRQSHVEIEEESLEGENDLDPELRKINEEGRRVGWTYRYRIRRKLDHLKQIQAETGVPFDLATLGGIREKKRGESKDHSTGKKSPEKTKSVVLKTRDEKKQEKPKKSEQKTTLDPESKSSTKNESKAGWQYRYRIRRKLDSEQNATPQDTAGGKRGKKSVSTKRKGKDKVTEQVSSSIPSPSLNTDNDDTPVIRYFRRTSSTLLSIAKKSLCLLPRSQPWSFCELENNERNPFTAQSSKPVVTKRLKTKKEHRAKQFIRSHTTKFGAEDKATERRVDETMKKLYKRPSFPPLQTPPTTTTTHEKSPKKPHRPLLKPGKSNPEEQIPVEKIISVASKKNKNKKQFQIIGQEVKREPKNRSPPSIGRTTSPPVELPRLTTTTTSPPRLRTLSEVIQDEAATILAPIRSSSRTPEEIQEEINETNESIQETNQRQRRTTKTTTTTTLIDSTTSGEEDNEATTTTDDDSQINQSNKLNLDKNTSSSS